MARTTKTPAEMVLELETKLAAARAKEAQQVAKGNPELDKLVQFRDSIKADLLIVGRELNGPQSYDNRRKGFELRLTEIDTGKAYATAQQATYIAQRNYLDTQIGILCEAIASGKEMDVASEVQNVLATLPEGPSNISELQTAAETAYNARKAFTASRSAKGSTESEMILAD